MDILSGLSVASSTVNSKRLFMDVLAGFGAFKLKEWEYVSTDDAGVLKEIGKRKGPWLAVTRNVKPGFYQKGIQYDTNSAAQHMHFGVGDTLGCLARVTNPGKVFKHVSPRWKNPTIDHFCGLDPRTNLLPSKFELVQSSALVEVKDLRDVIGKDEQVVVFTFPDLTDAERLAMAVEAYSLVGEPYDVFEIAKRFFFLIPNPKALKVCSTLTLGIWDAGNKQFKSWATSQGLDPESISPRDGLDFCLSPNTRAEAFCFHTDIESVVKTG